MVFIQIALLTIERIIKVEHVKSVMKIVWIVLGLAIMNVYHAMMAVFYRLISASHAKQVAGYVKASEIIVYFVCLIIVCWEKLPIGKHKNNNDWTCSLCDPSCRACLGPSSLECTSCNLGYFLTFNII